MLYIDLDGYWGDLDDLITVDDSRWTEDDVDEFTQASNDGFNRLQLFRLAESLTNKYKEI